MRKINIKVFENGKIPTKATKGSVGYDCYARIDNNGVVIRPHERKLINLGFGLSLPTGYGADIRPRSGLSKSGIDIALGLVDSDYRGEIKACVINNSNEDFIVEHGYRICQMVINKYETKINFIVVDELDSTVRGTNGFGSSGK